MVVGKLKCVIELFRMKLVRSKTRQNGEFVSVHSSQACL